MEHAIRKHCKVHFDEDPVLYESLSEKLEALIQQYKDNWDLLSQHLFDLRHDAEAGRIDDPHLIFPDHSAKFWNEVDKLLPDFSERKEWLRVHGAGMDL